MLKQINIQISLYKWSSLPCPNVEALDLLNFNNKQKLFPSKIYYGIDVF